MDGWMNIDGWPSVETNAMGWGYASLDRSVTNAACTLSDACMDNEEKDREAVRERGTMGRLCGSLCVSASAAPLSAFFGI